MKQNQMTYQEKVQLAKERETEIIVKQDNRTIPHLTNLNEDIQLSGKLYYNLT